MVFLFTQISYHISYKTPDGYYKNTVRPEHDKIIFVVLQPVPKHEIKKKINP